jgi:Predicted membrane protein
MRKKKVYKMMQMTMLLSMAIILHYAESMIELPAIPGIRLGFANIIGLLTLYMYGPVEMIEINFGRVLLASLLNGRIFTTGFWLSVSGVALATIVSILFKKYTKCSILGISIMSGVFHGIGQIALICYIYQQIGMIYYLPVLTLVAIPTGLFTGYIAYLTLKRLKLMEV